MIVARPRLNTSKRHSEIGDEVHQTNLPFLAALLLAPWPVAYAQNAGGYLPEPGTVQITPAGDTQKPAWSAFGRAIGSVTAGDLFYIDPGDRAADMVVTLYLTNADELAYRYRHLILRAVVYVKNTSGAWEKAAAPDGGLLPDAYITLLNWQASFTLSGPAKIKVAIDGGSASPRFYLTAAAREPARGN